MFLYILSVDFGNHQRDVRVHPEYRRIVDHDSAYVPCDWDELSGNVAACAKKRDVDLVERILPEFVDRDWLVAKLNFLSGRSAGCERANSRHREISALQDAEKL